MLVIEKNYDKEKLVTEWGFKKNPAFDIYTKILDENKEYSCKIMIKNNIVYFYYYDEISRLINIEFEDFSSQIENVSWEEIDYEIEIPDLIFDMIKKGIIIKSKK